MLFVKYLCLSLNPIYTHNLIFIFGFVRSEMLIHICHYLFTFRIFSLFRRNIVIRPTRNIVIVYSVIQNVLCSKYFKIGLLFVDVLISSSNCCVPYLIDLFYLNVWRFVGLFYVSFPFCHTDYHFLVLIRIATSQFCFFFYRFVFCFKTPFFYFHVILFNKLMISFPAFCLFVLRNNECIGM